MNENEIRGLIAEVKQGTLSRRSFIQKVAAIGIAAPIASQILAWHDVAMADARLPYKPSKAGGGGPLKVLLCVNANRRRVGFDDFDDRAVFEGAQLFERFRALKLGLGPTRVF
jgi:hypothetical protein